MQSYACEFCQAPLMTGILSGQQYVNFFPRGEERKVFAKRARVHCDCCTACGRLQNFRVIDPSKLL